MNETVKEMQRVVEECCREHYDGMAYGAIFLNITMSEVLCTHEDKKLFWRMCRDYMNEQRMELQAKEIADLEDKLTKMATVIDIMNREVEE